TSAAADASRVGIPAERSHVTSPTGRRLQESERQVYSSEKFDREKRDEVTQAQTSDYLSGSWVAGDSDLFPGSSSAGPWRRQLDQFGFSGPNLLDLRHSGRYRRHFEFRCCTLISQGRRIADSLGLSRALCDSAHYRCCCLWKSASSGHL